MWFKWLDETFLTICLFSSSVELNKCYWKQQYWWCRSQIKPSLHVNTFDLHHLINAHCELDLHRWTVYMSLYFTVVLRRPAQTVADLMVCFTAQIHTDCDSDLSESSLMTRSSYPAAYRSLSMSECFAVLSHLTFAHICECQSCWYHWFLCHTLNSVCFLLVLKMSFCASRWRGPWMLRLSRAGCVLMIWTGCCL